MGRPAILDRKLMRKIAATLGKTDITVVNRRVSGKAAKLGISAEAALVILAKEHGIGTSVFQRKLDPAKQGEIRDNLPSLFSAHRRNRKDESQSETSPSPRPVISKRASLKAAIEYLMQDEELRMRCQDILLAKANFDRPINQATLVLEERIRKKAQPAQKLVGENLVGYAFNENLAQSVLCVASKESDDQRGFAQILRGIVPAFRNKTHHHTINSFSREEAMRVCAFIDVLLRVVDASTKVK
jgi:uncharacterized protein (TIGR02391 family)